MPRERKGPCKICGSTDFYPAGGCKYCCANRPCETCGKTDRYENGRCRPCNRLHLSEYKRADPERCRAQHRASYAKHGDSWLEKRRNEYNSRTEEEVVSDSICRKRDYKKQRAERIAQGLCVYCAAPAFPGFVSCERCLEKRRNLNYLNRYGVSRVEAIAMLDAQSGGCAICKKVVRIANGIEKVSRREVACVDHVHATGVVRGVLCEACNASVGQDERLRLVEILAYLSKIRPVEVFPELESKRSEVRLRWLERQGGRCDSCKDVLPEEHKSRVALDHDHKTGLIRGVLCSRCNQILGRLRDDPKIIQAAIDYLTKHEDALVPKKASNG